MGKNSKHWILLAGLMGFCSMGYEQVLAFQVSSLTGMPRIWETWSIALFVLFMGIGAQLSDRSNPSKHPAWQDIASIELILSLAGIVIPLANTFLAIVYRIYIFENAQSAEISGASILGVACMPGVAAIGLLSGLELPFLIKNTELGKSPAKLLAVYYCGSLAGSAIFLALKASGLSIYPVVTLLATTNLLIFFAVAEIHSPSFTKLPPLVTSAILIFLATFGYDRIESIYLRAFYYGRTKLAQEGAAYTASESEGIFSYLLNKPNLPPIARFNTAYQTVDIVQHQSKTNSQAMYINGRFQISSESAEKYHHAFATVPIEMVLRPKQVLILGGGDGTLAHHLNKNYPEINITMIELDQKIVTTASRSGFFSNINGGIFDSGKITVIIADAFNFLRTNNKIYDGIYLDVTYPFDFDSMRFYSLEFLRLVTRSLSKDGFVVAGMAGDTIKDQELGKVIKSTFDSAGLRHSFSFTGGNDWFILATRDDLRDKGGGHVDKIAKLFHWKKFDSKFDQRFVHSLLKPNYFNLKDPFH